MRRKQAGDNICLDAHVAFSTMMSFHVYLRHIKLIIRQRLKHFRKELTHAQLHVMQLCCAGLEKLNKVIMDFLLLKLWAPFIWEWGKS